MAKTSDNIRPCNIGQSEAHNRRTPQYLAHINKDKIYLRTDLMDGNEAWVSPRIEGISLREYYRYIGEMVKAKTGRAMQTKDRTRVNPKTGKSVTVRGSTPIKEGVIVCKADTTMEQLQRYGELCHERWGITPLQIFIHRDEGHYETPGDATSWKPNYHAHIVWDWMNHDTGKSCKLSPQDMSEMQTLLAEALDMERGTSKELTGREHLERTDYIIAKQKQEVEKAQTIKKQAETEHQRIEEEMKELKQFGRILDDELADKKRQLEAADKENRESIKSGLANLLGKGKYAAIEKENEELRSENEQIKRSFPEVLKQEVSKRTEKLSAEKRKAEAERQALAKERDEAIRLLNEQKANEQQHIDRAVHEMTGRQNAIAEELQWKSALLNALADLLCRTVEVFRRAVAAIIDFASSQYKSVFSPSEAADIKELMRSYGGEDPEQQKSVGKWLVSYAENRKQLDPIELTHTYNEVNDIAEGTYDWAIKGNEKRIQR